ncbi:hypothetical protein ACFFQW_46635 [Umezawaea endophytica]|uniref:Uncharacterized protein n=1 Tax=Umezawaea endophytica TaxID=1654476 RepID=A0A9X2VW06_9PSEU|nr:hypothetical protein [Umezawaea endophytica]MCS7483694.1 hypothetical protein [Umezawaea endophytica]
MRLNWKDTWATILVLAAAALYVTHLEMRDVPFIADVRFVAAACFTLGIGAAVVGGWHRPVDTRALRFGAWFGSTASLLGVVALITAQPWSLALLVLNTLALWGFASLRHTGLFAEDMTDDTSHQENPTARRRTRPEQERP